MLVDALLETQRRSPARLAVADGTRGLTYRQLARLAAVLRKIIARETSANRVGIMLPASAAFPAVLFGALWAGRTAVPLNFLLNDEELSPSIDDAHLDLIVTTRHFAKLAAKLPARAVFLEDLPLKRGMVFASLRRLPKPPQIDADETAVVLFTSGTTARPRGVELTYTNLYSNCVDLLHSLNIEAPQRFLNILPPFHVFGLTANVLAPVVLGATVFAIPRFNPAAVLKTAAKEHISIILAIPSMYAAMLRSKSAPAEALKSIFLAVSGGEPLPDRVRTGMREKFGVSLHEGYGLTETSPVIAASSPTDYRDGTVGKPLRNVEILVKGDDGRPAPVGTDGEIFVRSPGVMKGYLDRPEDTRQAIDADGWFATGDLGHLDADGFLTISGRAKELLIIGGENVFPREIENVLEQHESVVQATVIGVPDDLRGEVPVAFVIPKPEKDVDEQALRSFAKQFLAGFKVPRRIIIREDLPKGPTGKIQKRRLHELL